MYWAVLALFSDHCGSSAPGREATASRNSRISAVRMLVSCRQTLRRNASSPRTGPGGAGPAAGAGGALVSVIATPPPRPRRRDAPGACSQNAPDAGDPALQPGDERSPRAGQHQQTQHDQGDGADDLDGPRMPAQHGEGAGGPAEP